MKTYNKRDIQIILRKNGYFLDRIKGSHAIYKKKGSPPITVGATGCNKMVLQRLIKQNGLKIGED